ncbi:MAG: FixH family protein [Planctomycetes bacterium]|nr:FixH family protein [Planctomycetota bacterium]
MATATAVPAFDLARAQRGAWKWPALIIGLILTNATIVGVTVYFATSDRTVTVEPDYYAKALAYDSVIQQRETNRKLGWAASPFFKVGDDGQTLELHLTLTDAAGKAVTDANVSALVFANLAPRDRQSVKLTPGIAPGEYIARVRPTATGQWRAEFTVSKGSTTFTNQSDLFLLAADSKEGAGSR